MGSGKLLAVLSVILLAGCVTPKKLTARCYVPDMPKSPDIFVISGPSKACPVRICLDAENAAKLGRYLMDVDLTLKAVKAACGADSPEAKRTVKVIRKRGRKMVIVEDPLAPRPLPKPRESRGPDWVSN